MMLFCSHHSPLSWSMTRGRSLHTWELLEASLQIPAKEELFNLSKKSYIFKGSEGSGVLTKPFWVAIYPLNPIHPKP